MQELVEAKKHFSRLGWFYLAAVLIIYALEAVVGVALYLAAPGWAQNADVSLLLSVLPMYLVGFPLLILILKKKVPAEHIEKRRMTPGQYVLAALMCMGLAYAANLLGLIITAVISLFTGKPVENAIAGIMTSVSPWSVLFYVVLTAPAAEEYIFRKLVVDRTVRYGQGVAVAVSGLMFGLFHGNLNQFVYAAVIGMFLAYLYVKTGNLKITISLHMLFNLIGGFLPVVLMRRIDLESCAAFLEKGDMSGLVALMQQRLAWFVLYGLFLFLVFAMLIAGVVLFIVFAAKGKFVFCPGRTDIPGKLKFSLVLGNVGMMAFGLFWVIRIVCQLFA